MRGRAVEAGRNPPRKILLELRRIFLREPRRHQRSRLRRTDSLPSAGLREYDVPEVDIGIDEGHSHEASLALLPQGSDDTVHRLGGMLVEYFDGLAGDQRSIHKNEGTMRTHDISGGLQVDSFTFR